MKKKNISTANEGAKEDTINADDYEADEAYYEMYNRRQFDTIENKYYDDEEDPDFEQEIEDSGFYTSRDIYAICVCPICNTDLLTDEIPNSKTYAFYCNVCDDYVKTEDIENRITWN